MFHVGLMPGIKDLLPFVSIQTVFQVTEGHREGKQVLTFSIFFRLSLLCGVNTFVCMIHLP